MAGAADWRQGGGRTFGVDGLWPCGTLDLILRLYGFWMGQCATAMSNLALEFSSASGLDSHGARHGFHLPSQVPARFVDDQAGFRVSPSNRRGLGFESFHLEKIYCGG